MRPPPCIATALATLLGLILAATPLVAGEGDRWAVSAGAFDTFDGHTFTEAGFEVRFQQRAFRLVPVVGLTLTQREGGYVLAGLRRDFRLSERWIATPHLAVTLYENGDAKDLGSAVEFRPGIEVAWRLSERSRIGVSLYHLSNGGLSGTNPGSESVTLVYSFGR